MTRSVVRAVTVVLLAILFIVPSAYAAEVVVQKHAVIRAEPLGTAARLGTAEKDARFPLLAAEKTNNWFKIQHNGAPAWIYSRSVKVENAGATIKLASFNVLHLGWGSSKDLGLLASVIASYDIVALQEVMKTPSVSELLGELSVAVEEAEGQAVTWQAVVSERLGRSTYKERYAFVYRTDRVAYVTGPEFVVADAADTFIREPYVATFRAGNFDFTIISMHAVFGDKVADARRRSGRSPRCSQPCRTPTIPRMM